MAHKKAGGSTQLGRDSGPKYLGTKVADGQTVGAGAVLVRQRGTKIRAGKHVKRGGDDTLFSLIAGKVRFIKKQTRRFHGRLMRTTFVNIEPSSQKA